MNTHLETLRKEEQGFTLVELAVVMIIIGLLIGGILKGQELIENARVTSTISSIEGFGAAYNGFTEKYNAVPGDMTNAVARIAGCNGITACADAPAATGGNGIINNVVGAAPAGEGLLFFGQLLAGNFISGMDGSAAAATFGVGLPASDIGGGYMIGDRRASAAAVPNFTGANMRPRPYVVHNGVAGAVANNSGALSTNQAARIDRKLDDGNGLTGVLQAATAGNCIDANGVYDEDNTADTCAVAYEL